MSKLSKSSSAQLVKKLANCTPEEAVEINAILTRRGVATVATEIVAEVKTVQEATEVKETQAVAVEAISYYQNNKETIQNYNKTYYQKKKDYLTQYSKEYYARKKAEKATI